MTNELPQAKVCAYCSEVSRATETCAHCQQAICQSHMDHRPEGWVCSDCLFTEEMMKQLKIPTRAEAWRRTAEIIANTAGTNNSKHLASALLWQYPLPVTDELARTMWNQLDEHWRLWYRIGFEREWGYQPFDDDPDAEVMAALLLALEAEDEDA